MNRRHPAAGFTLIELIVALVVISIGLTGSLLTIWSVTAHSADPMVRQQAQALAVSFMEEILPRSYSDPDGTEAGEDRATFDDVDDYNGIGSGNNGCKAGEGPPPCDQFGKPVITGWDKEGNPIYGLADYTVNVSVTATAIGPAGNSEPAWQVRITVNHTSGQQVILTGYRTSY